MRLRLLAPADIALYERWTAQDFVRGWWGGREHLFPLGDPRVSVRLIVEDEAGTPFAYAQLSASAHDATAHHVDFFIGEPSHLGKGYGSRILRAVTAWAAPGRFTIDPLAENAQARECYAKAGFREMRMADTASGPAVVMTHNALSER